LSIDSSVDVIVHTTQRIGSGTRNAKIFIAIFNVFRITDTAGNSPLRAISQPAEEADKSNCTVTVKVTIYTQNGTQDLAFAIHFESHGMSYLTSLALAKHEIVIFNVSNKRQDPKSIGRTVAIVEGGFSISNTIWNR
jgi:hypothetical protein